MAISAAIGVNVNHMNDVRTKVAVTTSDQHARRTNLVDADDAVACHVAMHVDAARKES